MTTTVPSIRDVKRRRADWWEADQVGRPITASMAFWLRKSLYKCPMNVVQGLARRGLHGGCYYGQELYHTPRGLEYRRLLGKVPDEHVGDAGYRRHPHDPLTRVGPAKNPIICQRCGAIVDAELIAWGTPLRQCIACATKDMP